MQFGAMKSIDASPHLSDYQQGKIDATNQAAFTAGKSEKYCLGYKEGLENARDNKPIKRLLRG